ncbi:hypothetical protein D3C78_1385080 [compost metagenome]
MERIFSATAGLTFAVQLSCRLWSSIFFSCASMLSGCQPRTLRINAGDLFIFTARLKEKITSSAVSGLPEAKVACGRSLMVRVLATASPCQLSASTGSTFAGSSRSACTSR